MSVSVHVWTPYHTYIFIYKKIDFVFESLKYFFLSAKDEGQIQANGQIYPLSKSSMSNATLKPSMYHKAS